MLKYTLVAFLLDAILLSFDVWAAEIDVYAVAEDDLFETRLSGLMVLKSAIYNDEVGEATLREDGSFERMIKDGKIMLLRRGDQLRVMSSGTRDVPCTVIRDSKEIGKWFYGALFMSSDLKRLNRLGEERMRAEVEHNAPRDSALGRPFHLGPSPAAAKREHEQERKDALRGADYRAWSSYGGMMVEAEFRGLADGKVTLIKRGGAKVLLPFADLFVEDQEWITDAVKRNAAIENAKYRNWTDSTGKYKTEAEFGGMVGQKVTFIKRDGSKVQVPLEKLSDEDREWIAKRKK